MKKILEYLAVFAIVIFMMAFVWYVPKPEESFKNTPPAQFGISQRYPSPEGEAEEEPVIVDSSLFHYIEILDGCGPYYDLSPCVNMRSGPGLEYPIVARLRTNMVLRVEGTTVKGGLEWYKIVFDGEIRYPERVKGDWYVAVDPDSILPLRNVGDEEIATDKTPSTTKRIVVDLSEEMLYAYDGDDLFMKGPVSTGLEFTPTPIGEFKVLKKTPSRYMQGPIAGVSDQYYDLPGVPWNLYFTKDGSVIHGAYWHNNFGRPWSHGCVNLAPHEAEELYLWADVGMPVTVKR